MIDEMTVLAIVPARGGSKGLPGKNLAALGGKPLLAWTIEAASASVLVDRVVASSEDAAIIETARHYGCEVPFIRPAELAGDDTPGIDVVLHALSEVPGFDIVVLLQPTSPLRIADDIDAAVRLLRETGAPAVVGVCRTAKPPEWMYYRSGDGRLSPVLEPDTVVTRRQEARAAFYLNGAVYVARVDWLMNKRSFMGPATIGYEMPAERSIDIDTDLDLALAEIVLRR